MEEEIVARKANLIWIYALIMAFGLAVMILGIFLNFSYDWTVMLFFLGIGLIFIAVGVIGLVVYLKMPKVYITYKDGKLHFADGTECYPHEIEHVLFNLTRTYGIESSMGGLVVTVHGRKIKYNNVKKIKAVESRLGELFTLSRNAYIKQLMELEEKEKESDESSSDSGVNL